jgi:UDP-GlcNAc:undecaprenyl-phosphate GlcNAc-1-phosphate transferase
MDKKIALLSPLFILGLPILDTAVLIIIRMNKKKVPFNKSNDHLYLRFLRLGYTKKKALCCMLGICAVLSLGGVLLSRTPLGYSPAILAGTVIFIAFVLLRPCREKKSLL